MDLLWTVAQTAEFLHLKQHQVYFLLGMGEIEAVKIRYGWRVNPKGVRDYAQSRLKGDAGRITGITYDQGSVHGVECFPMHGISNDLRQPAESIQGRKLKRVEHTSVGSNRVLFKKLKPVIQLELFS